MSCEAPANPAPVNRRAVVELTAHAHQWMGQRLGREFISVPALDMLLDLYLHETRRPKSLTSLCGASPAPARTALRTINRMVEHGLLLRTPDPDDARRIHVELSAKALQLLDDYFDRLLALLDNVERS